MRGTSFSCLSFADLLFPHVLTGGPPPSSQIGSERLC